MSPTHATKEFPVQARRLRTYAAPAAAALLMAAAGGCGSDDEEGTAASGGGGDAAGAKIAFLMPDTASTRYELADKPLFEKRLKELCPDCSVLYQNADADAAKQQQQADSAITQGVKAIVLDPVDSAAAATTVQKAKAAGIPVIAYDRPIPQTPADYYVSFDNEKLGQMFAQSLVDKVKKENPDGGLLQVNGSPTDAAAGLIKKGMHSAIDPSGLKLLAEYDTPDWTPAKAQDWVAGQITRYKDQIDGVVAANDGTGGGAISAFKSAGVDPVPPVSGNDAELAAAQRILAGDQYNTISKPIKIVAGAAAEIAYAFAQGKGPKGETTLVKVLSGVHAPTAGSIAFEGREVTIPTPAAAQELGIATVFQDLALCENLNVVENLFLGQELRAARLDEVTMEVRSWELLKELSAKIPTVRIPVASLSGGQRQTVAIARSLLGDPKIIMLDEPTAALGVAQTAEVLNLIERLRERGHGVIMISHNMADVQAVADTIVVLRLGRNNGVFRVGDVSSEELVAAITGASDNVVSQRSARRSGTGATRVQEGPSHD